MKKIARFNEETQKLIIFEYADNYSFKKQDYEEQLDKIHVITKPLTYRVGTVYESKSSWHCKSIKKLNLGGLLAMSKGVFPEGRPNPTKQWFDTFDKKILREAKRYPASECNNYNIYTDSMIDFQSIMLKALLTYPELLELSKRFPQLAFYFAKLQTSTAKSSTGKKLGKRLVKKFFSVNDQEKFKILGEARKISNLSVYSKSNIKTLRKITHKSVYTGYHSSETLTKARHLTKVNNAALQAVRSIDQKYIKSCWPIIELLSKQGNKKNKDRKLICRNVLQYLIDATRLFEHNEVKNLPTIRDYDHMIQLHNQQVANWNQRAFHYDESGQQDYEFPTPPIPGTDKIIPITRHKALNEEGVKMHHCVVTYANSVKKGECYIYHVNGTKKEQATLELVNHSGTWKIAQLRGPCNAIVSNATRDIVNSWLAQS